MGQKKQKIPESYREAEKELVEIQEKMEKNEYEIDQLESLIDRGQFLIEFCEKKLRELEEKIDKSFNI